MGFNDVYGWVEVEVLILLGGLFVVFFGFIWFIMVL